MDWEIEKAYSFDAGKKEGEQMKAIEVARKLLADGKYSAEEISALLQIPVEAFAETVKSSN